ncbi:MAG: hypothetical protein ABI556_12205 [Gemmatimonadales bacterium]
MNPSVYSWQASLAERAEFDRIGLMNSTNTVTRSRTIDRVLFGALFLIMLASSPRLIVYNRSTQVGATRVEVVSIDAAGARLSLGAPSAVQGLRLRATIAAIEAFAETRPAHMLTPQGGRLEWTLRYSVRSWGPQNQRARVLTTQ